MEIRKNIRFLIICLSFFCLGTACNSNRKNVADSIEISVPEQKPVENSFDPEVRDTVLLGDINSDRISDTAFIYTPPTGDFKCKNDSCYSRITFNGKIPEIYIDYGIWPVLEKLPDVNNDGINEIIVYSHWFIGFVRQVYVYSLSAKGWTKISEATCRYEEDMKLRDLVKKQGKYFYLKGIDYADGEETVTWKKIGR